jgi:hypothetical protein
VPRRRLVDPVRRARADARDRLQTVRPTRAFDPQAHCPPRLAPLAPPVGGAVRHLNRLRRQPAAATSLRRRVEPFNLTTL